MSAEISNERAWEMQLSRDVADAAVLSYAPSGIDRIEAEEIFRRLLVEERRLFPDGDYLNGSARFPDDVLTFNGTSQTLLTAEHASIQQRLNKDGERKPKEADICTGGLAVVVGHDTDSSYVVSKGMQTGDPNNDEEHTFKDVMSDVMIESGIRAHLSVHMLDRGRAADPEDNRGYSIMLGLGHNPSPATLALADFVRDAGKDYGLRVGVNQPHIRFNSKKELRRNVDGSLKTVTFAAAGKGTTRTFSQAFAEEHGRGEEFAAMQLEINEVLLAAQNDEVAFPALTDRVVGSYLGYLVTRSAVESVARL